MDLKKILIPIFLFAALYATAQGDTFTDPRDGRTYPIELIDDTWWFASNLQYESAGSHCPHTSKRDCTDSNFYPYTELQEVCPDGWHVSTMDDWNKYIAVRSDQLGIQDLQVKTYDTDGIYNISYTETADTSRRLSLFAANAPLALSTSGWVQGKRRQRMQGLSLWATNPELMNDPKFHLHIGLHSYVEHTHEHHIVDKPRRTRKFAVRCVKD